MCEGDDDKAFLEALIETRRLPEFQICRADECNGKGVGGRSGFGHSLAGFRPTVGFGGVQAILIVSDNDKAGSFAEVQEAFTKNGHTPPLSPSVLGSIDGKPTAVFMLPSTSQNGDLEVLCLPEIHRVWPDAPPCVDAYMACSGADKWQKQSSINKARARAAIVGFHEDDPYRGIGHLFRKKILDPSNPCFDHVAEFLRNFDAFTGIANAAIAAPAAIQQLLPPANS